MIAKSEQIFRDLQYFYLNKETASIFTKPLKDLVKTIWDKVFKRGSNKVCGRQPLKNLKGYGRLWSA